MTSAIKYLAAQKLGNGGGPKPRDITGLRSGLLVAAEQLRRVAGGRYVWRCLCDCGKTIEAFSSELVHARRRSCGCARPTPVVVPPRQFAGVGLLIPLRGGVSAIVDHSDAVAAAMKWNLMAHASRPDVVYAQRTFMIDGRRTTILLHRFLMQPPVGLVVDHRNGDGLDCRRHNLRICTELNNCQNKTITPNQRVGRYKGTFWEANTKRWAARIKVSAEAFGFKSRSIYLGAFDDPRDAALAYDRAARRYFGEFAAPNFPEAAP